MCCEQCGAETEDLTMVDGLMMCDSCRYDYLDMHPSMEYPICTLEYREER